jgi:FG-GAP-like repeat/FG-GAP repeat
MRESLFADLGLGGIAANLGSIILVALVSGCGSSGDSGPPPPPPPPPARIVVTVSPETVDIPLNSPQVFDASVQNDPSNRGVTWSLKGTGCNGGPCGSLDAATGNSVTYTRPAVVSSPVTETLTATAMADANASATATITLPVISVNVSPASATLALGDSRQLSAEVANDGGNQGVTWNLSGCPTGVDCGSLSPASTASGEPTMYTAPTSLPHDVQVTVTATTVADPTRTAAAALTISITAKEIRVSISPAAASVRIGETAAFTATVSNGSADSAVTWTIDGCTNDPCGSLGSLEATSATYAAPQPSNGAQAGNRVTVTATSNDSPNRAASATVTLTPSRITFSTQNLAAGTSPDSVAIADFNGDGKGDVAVADQGDASSGDNGDVSILLGARGGAFRVASHVPAGKNPIYIAVGDLNGDRKPDLIVSNLGERPAGGKGDVNVLLGKGDGTFQAPVSFAAGDLPFTLAVGDFNQDSKPDVAVSDFGAVTDGGIQLLLGNGNGGFESSVLLSAGPKPAGVAAGDLNGDAKLDLAVADNRSPSTIGTGGVTVLLGNGDGSFQAPSVLFKIVSLPTSIAIGELNTDGKPDLVVSSYIGFLGASNSTLNVLMGDGTGSFTTTFVSTRQNTRGPAPFPLSAKVADFDGDTKQDVVEVLGSAVAVLEGDGSGAFPARLLFAPGTHAFALAVGDFNGDGKPDLAVANQGSNDVSIMLNTSGP